MQGNETIGLVKINVFVVQSNNRLPLVRVTVELSHPCVGPLLSLDYIGQLVSSTRHVETELLDQ